MDDEYRKIYIIAKYCCYGLSYFCDGMRNKSQPLKIGLQELPRYPKCRYYKSGKCNCTELIDKLNEREEPQDAE